MGKKPTTGNGHGGTREGAGPPTKEVRQLRLDASRNMARWYAEDQRKFYDTLKGLAFGTFKVIDGHGEVYTELPSFAALKELNDRGMGKAIQPIEVTDGDNKPDASDPVIESAKQGLEKWSENRRAAKNARKSSGSA